MIFQSVTQVAREKNPSITTNRSQACDLLITNPGPGSSKDG